LELVFQSALKQEYNQTHKDRLQLLLDSYDQEILKLVQTRQDSASIIQVYTEQREMVDLALEQARERIPATGEVDWATKRLFLYLLGVRVEVFHTGTFDDGFGNRWRIGYTNAGLLDMRPGDGVIVRNSSKSVQCAKICCRCGC
jgi:hypothetical protein